MACYKGQRSKKDHCGGYEKCLTSPHLARNDVVSEETVVDGYAMSQVNSAAEYRWTGGEIEARMSEATAQVDAL